MKKLFYYETPIGRIGIAEDGAAVTDVFFGDAPNAEEFEIGQTPLLREAGDELLEYTDGRRRIFQIPLNPVGTEFEKNVWAALSTIPFGETRSYGDVAKQIGNPKACRAVGRANSVNPIPIFIPCHRVIGSSGKLVGFAGGLDMKRKLLALENIRID